MKRFLIACLILSAAPAYAQERERSYKGGLNHTYIRKFEPAAGTPEPSAATPTTKATETPTSTVWKKYKALAAGTTTKEEPDNKTPSAPQKPTEPTVNEAKTKETQPPPQTGIAAIIADYKRSKERKSQVRHLQVTRPKAPTTPKPAAPPENSPPTP